MTLHDFMTSLKPLVLLWEDAWQKLHTVFEFLLAWEDLESFVFVRHQSELSEEKTKAVNSTGR